MKKVLFAFALLVGIGGSASAQEASKTKKAPLTRAEASAEKKAVDAPETVAVAEATEVIAETDGKVNRQAPEVVEAEKARRMEAEKAKAKKN
ncbi:MAG: hypothetical protein EOO01_11295 [Chitinophagaceae bacterium]|nr:MAG: hypothetical protein EOO01_11295 [Chitinophagaceae bacterium]